MDEQRFDGLSKQLGASSRRRVLLGVVAAAVPGLLSQRPTAATSKRHQRHQAGRRHGSAKASSNAGPPQPVDPTPFTLPAGDPFCAFEVQAQLSGTSKTINLPGDRQIITAPGENVTFTNLETKKQITLNITGASHVEPQANGDVLWVATGRNILIDPISEPNFALARGRFTWIFNAAGDLIQPRSGDGLLTDVCSLLA